MVIDARYRIQAENSDGFSPGPGYSLHLNDRDNCRIF